MKNILLLFIILIGSGLGSFAQSSATATATATIVTPISITKNVDMNFGNISATNAGTVVLVPAGTRTNSGGVTLPASAGTVSAAEFNVTGTAGFTFGISLPQTELILTNATGNQTMTVNTFTSTPSSTGTLTTGATSLKVGATLNVKSGQAAGIYTNAAGFNVIVNYN